MLSIALSAALRSPNVDIFEHARQAILFPGGKAWKETRVTGTAEYYGVPDEYSFLFDSDGRFVQSFKGSIQESFGSDGTAFWEVDRSRTLDMLDFEDRDRELALSLLLTSRWLDQNAPIAISADGNFLRLKLKGSGQEETIRVDPESGLPVEATFPVA